MPAPSGLIVGWPSTEASIPAGWSRVAAMDSRYPLPGSSFGGTGSGSHGHTANSHTHNYIHAHGDAGTGGSTFNTSVFTGGAGDDLGDGGGHGHGLTVGSQSAPSASGSASTSTGVQELPRLEVIWIQSNGTTDIPQNAIVWSTVTAPAGWRNADGSGGAPDARNRYLRGAATGTDGGSTGSAGHDHQVQSHVHAGGSHSGHGTTSQATTGGGFVAPGASSPEFVAPTGHGGGDSGITTTSATFSQLGAISGTGTNSPTTEPLWYKLNTIQRTTGGSAEPDDIVALWSGTTSNVPSGWTLYTAANGRFAKGVNTIGEVGDTGGATTHSHTHGHVHGLPTGTHQHGTSGSIGGLGAIAFQAGANSFAAQGHGHAASGSTGSDSGSRSVSGPSNTGTTTGSNTPNYVDVILIRKITVLTVTLGRVTETETARLITPALTARKIVNVGRVTETETARPIARAIIVSLGRVTETEAVRSFGLAAAVFAGPQGVISRRVRFEWRTSANAFVQDITDAFELTGAVHLDNDRPVTRTCQLTVLLDRLPGGFDITTDHVAILYETRASATVRQSHELGLFRFDEPRIVERPGSSIANISGTDRSWLLQTEILEDPLTIAATAYTVAVETLLDDRSIPNIITPDARIMPLDMTWPAGTPILDVINDLLVRGINYYPLWMDGTGTAFSRPRIDPPDNSSDIHYRSDIAPQMIIPPFVHQRRLRGIRNVIAASVQDPSRVSIAGSARNDDAASPWSTVNVPLDYQQFTLDRIYDLTTLQDWSRYELFEATGAGEQITLETLPDPRRTNREYYQLTVQDEAASLWRAASWRLDLGPNGTMRHDLEKAIDFTETIT